jgi:hypothetical protein
MLKRIGALVGAAALVVSTTAYAAENANQGALSQGTPAGVKQAESWAGSNQMLWLLGGGIVVGGIILVATGNGHNAVGPCPLAGCTAPTTTTTTTTRPPLPVTTTTTTTTTKP